MSSISNILNQFPDFHPLSSNTPVGFKSQQFQARAETSTSSQLSFLTTEGDRVSISAGSESRFSFDSYTAQGFSEGQAVDIRNQQSSSSLRSDFSLLVEGDLNEQELADIEAFVQTAENLFNNLRSGNVDEAAETALSLSNLETLSTAALFYRQETTVSVATRSTSLAAQGNEASQPSQGRGFAAGQNSSIENFLERIRKAQEQFQIDPEILATRVPTLLSALVDSLSGSDSEEDAPQSLLDQIREEFLKSLLQATRALTTEEETLEKVVEKDKNTDVGDSAPVPTEANDEILPSLSKDSELS